MAWKRKTVTIEYEVDDEMIEYLDWYMVFEGSRDCRVLRVTNERDIEDE